MEQQIVSGVIGKLREHLYSQNRRITGLSYRLANYLAPETYEYLTDYRPLPEAQLFTGSDTVFIKGEVTFPTEIRNDEDYEDCLFLQLQNIGGIVFIDDEPYHGIDQNRDRIPLRPEWAGQTKELRIEGYYLNVCYNPADRKPSYLAYAAFRRVDKKLDQFIYDIRMANDTYLTLCADTQGSRHRICKRITAAFEEAIRQLDVALPGEAFRQRAMACNAIFRERLAEIDDGDIDSRFSLVASTHIDTAWLWQLKDTVRKCGHSYSNVLRLMDIYPDYRFSGSQVKLLAYTKEYYPAIYEQIKQAAREGRWENVGPMWVESDCNIISGESMVRQLLMGTDFLQKEFGSVPRLAWLPDTFGFQPNLPQIFQKSGIDCFYSYKLHWQAQEKFPYGNFKWKGIDGSEILGAVINNPLGAYNGFPNPAMLTKTQEAYDQQGEVDEVLFSFGYGDGGGGPNREMLEYAQRLTDFPGLPKCRLSTAQEYFDRLEAYRETLPTWYGELYIQTHRGTLTTESSVKKHNRRVEQLYPALEKLGIMAQARGAKPRWELLQQGWEKALVLQFHDILPGSSIDAVYDDCRRMYAQVYDLAGKFLRSIGMDTEVKTAGKVVNTLSWDRDVLASFHLCTDTQVTVTMDGKAVPTVCIPQGDGMKVTFLAQNVPALSGVDFAVMAGEASQSGMAVTEEADGITVENERYCVSVDGTGRLTALFDKRIGRQLLRAPGNDIRLFLDGPSQEDAWNIYENYKTREVPAFTESDIRLTENNSLRTVLHARHQGQRFTLEQDIIFYQHSDRIDFETKVDWQEKNKVLRVYFPTALNAPSYTSEVGFGAYSRPTVGNTNYEKSKFEVAAHRFIDISENGCGVALLNDSKYGHDVCYDTIGMTLLRSTGFPARYPDLGEHRFNYSLLPHRGTWAQAGVPRAAMELNAQHHTPCVFGKANFTSGLFRCEDPNLIIDTVKKTQQGDGIVVRLYEACGMSGSAKLHFAVPVATVTETDLLEKPVGEPALEDGGICLNYTPYAVKTFVVTLP